MRHTPRLAAVVVAALALSACGGDDEPVAAVGEPADEPAPCEGELAGDPGEIAPPGVVTSAQGCEIMRFESVTLIDVRTPAEYDEAHIEGAELVDLSSGDFPAEIGAYDPDGEYLIYCRSGNRSAQAAAIMRELGFEQVWDMGGIIDWEAGGFPVVS